jgi:hypothetical protein
MNETSSSKKIKMSHSRSATWNESVLQQKQIIITDDKGPGFIWEIAIVGTNCSHYVKQLFEFCLDVRIILPMLKVYIADAVIRKLELLKQKEKESDSN